MHQVASHDDLARLADGALATVRVEHAHLHQWHGPPGVAGPAAAVPVQDGQPGDLGLPRPRTRPGAISAAGGVLPRPGDPDAAGIWSADDQGDHLDGGGAALAALQPGGEERFDDLCVGDGRDRCRDQSDGGRNDRGADAPVAAKLCGDCRGRWRPRWMNPLCRSPCCSPIQPTSVGMNEDIIAKVFVVDPPACAVTKLGVELPNVLVSVMLTAIIEV